MLYYRAMSDDVFSSYLYNNTKIDRPDRGVFCEIAVAEGSQICAGNTFTEDDRRSILYNADGTKRSKKCNFGYIYKEGNDYYFTLNFQIRFK